MANTDDSAAKVAGSQAAGDDGIDLSGGAGGGAETAENKQDKDLTKRMSERINKIREAEVAPLQKKLEELTAEKREWTEKEIKLRAFEEGKTVEEVQEEIKNRNKFREDILKNDPEVQQMRQIVIEHQKAQLLDELRKEYPDDNITSIDDLGDEYKRLLMAKVDPFKAYEVVRDSAKKEQPKDKALPGSAKSAGDVIDKEYYTEAEIDNFTRQDYLDNPGLMEKVKRSLSRLK